MNGQEIEKDIFQVSQIIVSSTTGVNSFYPESRFLEAVEIPKEWDEYKKYFEALNTFFINISFHVIKIIL